MEDFTTGTGTGAESASTQKIPPIVDLFIEIRRRIECMEIVVRERSKKNDRKRDSRKVKNRQGWGTSELP